MPTILSSHHTPLWTARLLSPWWQPHWQQSGCEVPLNLSHSTLVKPHCSGLFSRATAPALNLLQLINVFPVLEGGNTGHSTYMWSSEHWEGDNHCPWCPGCAPVDAALDVVGHFCCQGMLVSCAHVMVWNSKHSTETSFQLFFLMEEVVSEFYMYLCWDACMCLEKRSKRWVRR